MAYTVTQVQPENKLIVDNLRAVGLEEAMSKARVIVKREGFKLATQAGDHMVFTSKEDGHAIVVKVEQKTEIHPSLQRLLSAPKTNYQPQENLIGVHLAPAPVIAPAAASPQKRILPKHWRVEMRGSGQPPEIVYTPCSIVEEVRAIAARLGFPGSGRLVSGSFNNQFTMMFRRGRGALTLDAVQRQAGDEE